LKKSTPNDRHLDTSAALDFLEQRLNAGDRRAVEEHLGRPCRACLDRIHVLGEMLETMRADRVGEVPAALHQRAVAVFVPVAKPSMVQDLVDRVAELLFDSAQEPLMAGARRSVGEARRLRFRLGSNALDLEIEREGSDTLSIRGRMMATDAHLWNLAVEAGSEQRNVRPDADGSFVLDRLPVAPLTLQLRDATQRFRLPTLEP